MWLNIMKHYQTTTFLNQPRKQNILKGLSFKFTSIWKVLQYLKQCGTALLTCWETFKK